MISGLALKQRKGLRFVFRRSCEAALPASSQFLLTKPQEYIPSDNGSEFVAEEMQNYLVRGGIKTIRIQPGSLWENGYDERFNGTLHREILNAEWFTTTKQAQIIINHWLWQYNHTRPHQALNMRSPLPETLIRNGPELGGQTVAGVVGHHLGSGGHARGPKFVFERKTS